VIAVGPNRRPPISGAPFRKPVPATDIAVVFSPRDTTKLQLA